MVVEMSRYVLLLLLLYYECSDMWEYEEHFACVGCK